MTITFKINLFQNKNLEHFPNLEIFFNHFKDPFTELTCSVHTDTKKIHIQCENTINTLFSLYNQTLDFEEIEKKTNVKFRKNSSLETYKKSVILFFYTIFEKWDDPVFCAALDYAKRKKESSFLFFREYNQNEDSKNKKNQNEKTIHLLLENLKDTYKFFSLFLFLPNQNITEAFLYNQENFEKLSTTQHTEIFNNFENNILWASAFNNKQKPHENLKKIIQKTQSDYKYLIVPEHLYYDFRSSTIHITDKKNLSCANMTHHCLENSAHHKIQKTKIWKQIMEN